MAAFGPPRQAFACHPSLGGEFLSRTHFLTIPLLWRGAPLGRGGLLWSALPYQKAYQQNNRNPQLETTSYNMPDVKSTIKSVP
jgi:hypothetical protein